MTKEKEITLCIGSTDFTITTEVPPNENPRKALQRLRERIRRQANTLTNTVRS